MSAANAPVPAVTVLRNPLLFIAFGFGTGLAPKAPGTAGTVVGVLLHVATADLGLGVRALIVAAVSLAGIGICGAAARALKTHDHPGIVWDEIAGFMLTMLVAPPGFLWIVLGFTFFRLFDIVKPWPIRELDRRVGGGLGIMIDDIAAGVYAALALLAVSYGVAQW